LLRRLLQEKFLEAESSKVNICWSGLLVLNIATI